jgi:broad specificity phosphatase PhoE
VARLYLIRHSVPAVEPGLPPREWRLTDDGRARAERLADRLAGAGIARFATSDEAKARATGEVMAARLGLPVETAPGLHEQDRTGAPHLSADAFARAIAGVFARPGERVFGRESADEAHDRFAAAVDSALARWGEGLAVVGHGTVMALYIGRRNRRDPHALWQSLGMPCCAVLELPDGALVEIAEP